MDDDNIWDYPVLLGGIEIVLNFKGSSFIFDFGKENI